MKNMIMMYLFVTFGLMQVSTVFAQADQKAMQRAQYMLRQLNAEKSALQADMQKLKEEYDAYKKETEKKLAQSEKREKKLKSTLSNWKESHGNIKDSLQKHLVELAHYRQRGQLLEQALGVQTENFNLCRKNNQNLATINYEILGEYQDKGIAQILKQGEPVTGIAKVSVENYIQDTQYRIEDLDLKKSAYLIERVPEVPADKTLDGNTASAVMASNQSSAAESDTKAPSE